MECIYYGAFINYQKKAIVEIRVFNKGDIYTIEKQLKGTTNGFIVYRMEFNYTKLETTNSKLNYFINDLIKDGYKKLTKDEVIE